MGTETMTRSAPRKLLLAVGTAALLIGGLAGCEPPPPRLQLAVNSSLPGADSNPGDGTCSSSAAGGACTLVAAIQEGSTAPDGADVTVPAGHYTNMTTTVTGDVALLTGSGDVSITASTITVESGGRLSLSDVNTSTSIAAPPPSFPDNLSSSVSLLHLNVAGEAVVARSILGGLHIPIGGNVLAVDSIVGTTTTIDAGSLLAVRSSLFANSANGPAGTAMAAGPGASTRLAASVLAVPHTSTSLGIDFPGGQGTCTGPAPTSFGHLFVEVPCGTMDGDGDGSGNTGTVQHVNITYTGIGYQETGAYFALRPTSPLIDAIPLGHPACPPGAVDVYGQPRGIDGNGDGIPGCDIGAVEHQPA